MSNSEDKIYLNGRLIDRSQAAISPDDRGFLFADGVYEMIRLYGGVPFEIDSHAARLRRSLGELRIEGFDAGGLGKICASLVSSNGLEKHDATFYIQITRGAAPRSHLYPENLSPTVYGFASEFTLPRKEWKQGIAVMLTPDTRWARCDIKSIALLPNILARQAAERAGADEAVFTKNGVVTEGSSSTFCAVIGGRLLTHPQGEGILSGITRKVVLRLCPRLGIPFAEETIPVDDLEGADEMMILSTTREVMPVVRIDGRSVSEGVPGPVTRKLQEEFAHLAGRAPE